MATFDKAVRLARWSAKNWRSVTLAKVLNFLRAKYRQVFESDNRYVREQVLWRTVQVMEKSPACIESGACVHCGCDTPDKFNEPDACEHGCYPAWMDPKEWEDFKQVAT